MNRVLPLLSNGISTIKYLQSEHMYIDVALIRSTIEPAGQRKKSAATEKVTRGFRSRLDDRYWCSECKISFSRHRQNVPKPGFDAASLLCLGGAESRLPSILQQ